MKQQLKRLTISTQAQIQFRYKAKRFFVKNFTEDDIYVSFEAVENNDYSECYKIAKGVAEEVYVAITGISNKYLTDTIYIYGTGEVEVQQLDFSIATKVRDNIVVE